MKPEIVATSNLPRFEAYRKIAHWVTRHPATMSQSAVRTAVDPTLISLLACPRSGASLRVEGDYLVSRTCASIRYPVIEGIPVLLTEEFGDSGSGAATHTFKVMRGEAETYSPMERQSDEDDNVDPIVQTAIAATGGKLYRRIIGGLKEYPVPTFPDRCCGNKVLLDIGCHWGRWTIAAARAGYQSIGLDPSLNAVLAGRRIAKKLGVEVHFVVGDARHLPFRRDVLNAIFSFSVLQHFSRSDVQRILDGIHRILKSGGKAMVQMPNRWSLLGVFHLIRRGFREGRGFDVRYWTLSELRDAFERCIGPTEIGVDAFFSLNAQPTDIDLLPRFERTVVRTSMHLKQISKRIAPLRHVADSLMIHARKS